MISSNRLGTDYLEKHGMVADHQPAADQGNHTSHEHPIATSPGTHDHSHAHGSAEKGMLLSSDSDLADEAPDAALGPTAQILGVAILGELSARASSSSSDVLSRVRCDIP
jgi:hypothetical protein